MKLAQNASYCLHKSTMEKVVGSETSPSGIAIGN